MSRPGPYDALTDERLYRQNANINQNVAGHLSLFETGLAQMVKWCIQLGLDPEEELGALLKHTEGLAGWTRAHAHLGSDQVVQLSTMHIQQGELGRDATSPSLKPYQAPDPKTMAHVVYKDAKSLQKDVRKKRWKL